MRAKALKFPFLLIMLFVFCLAGAEKGAFKAENSARTVLTAGETPDSGPGGGGIAESDGGPFPVQYLDELEREEVAGGKYYCLVDEKNAVITKTGRRIRPGDRYLDDKNRLYEVRRVRGYTATARYLRTEKIKKPALWGFASANLPGGKDFQNLIIRALSTGREKEISKEASSKKLIAIYHTHNDESYVPTDGTDSVYGHGGIHQVGAALQQALEEKNINAIHAENMHLPHDDGAYRRSRDTALHLLQQDPDAIFDLHRDAAPLDAYAVQIGEDWVTKIQFVVGRENPSSAVTSHFAYDMKGLADDIYPGLIKGIFMGWGDFNQDLTPLNLLLEVGAHENSREAAEKGITLFADVVAKYFYGIPVQGGEKTPPGVDKPGAVGSSVGGTIAVIVSLVAAALAGFYFLNNPGALKRFKGQLKFYLGQRGIIWREGLQNIRLTGGRIAAAWRTVFVYLFIVGEFIRVLFLRMRERLKGLK